jgi:acyl-CoA dehydrogenase
MMRMNVQPIPTLDDEVNQIRMATAEIVNKEILPNENYLWVWRDEGRFTESDVARSRELR